MRGIELGIPLIVVVAPAGSGKTLLLDMTERACCERSVRRIERGDLAHTVLGEPCDLLLVDEADSVD
jgi:ribose 1,5-bisphosphokinase PhnN